MAVAVREHRTITTIAGAIAFALLSISPGIAIAPSRPVIDIDGLSSDVYDHPSASARARSAIFDTVPVGLPLSAAKARLERSGMHCVAGVTLRCYASIFENVDYRDYSSIMWRVAVRSENGRVSAVRAAVN